MYRATEVTTFGLSSADPAWDIIDGKKLGKTGSYDYDYDYEMWTYDSIRTVMKQTVSIFQILL